MPIVRTVVILAAAFAGLGGALIGAGRLFFTVRQVADEQLLLELQSRTLSAPPTVEDSGDWPQWRGPHRDGVSRETGVLLEWPNEGLKERWRVPIGPGFSNVVTANGRLFTMEGDARTETVRCRETATGKEHWAFTYERVSTVDYGPGPRSTPAVSGGAVFTVGNTGLMHALDVGSGELLWKRDLVSDFAGVRPQWGVSFSPLVAGGRLYVMPGGKNASVAALDPKTGRTLWSALDDAAGYSSPILIRAAGEEQVVFFTATRLVGLTPDTGRLLWAFDWPTDFGANVATPIGFDDYLFISSGYGKGCALLKLERRDGAFEIRAVYTNNRMRNHFSSSVLQGNFLYGFDESALVCIDVRTGDESWREKGFNKGSILVVAGHLVVLSERGQVILAEANPERFRSLATFRGLRGRAWTSPVLSQGTLYLRDETTLVAYDARKLIAGD